MSSSSYQYSGPAGPGGGPTTISLGAAPVGGGGGGGGGGGENIVDDFPWTISLADTSRVPYIELIEYEVGQNQLAQAVNYYTNVVAEAGGSTDLNELYKSCFNKDKPTGKQYRFPYFNKIAYEVTTPNWSKIDSPQDILNKGKNLISSAFGDVGRDVAHVIISGGSLAVASQSPLINMVDRPRVFTEHNERSLTVQFPLFNTPNSKGDYQQNYDFWYSFAKANLYEKNTPITGKPPVFYEVTVPGQYYSYASCVTNMIVENLGNVRFYSNKIIPDALQFTITLTEMVMPSKNQFSKIYS